MKSIITILVLLSTFSCYSQEEKEAPDVIEETDKETRFSKSPKLENLNSDLNGLYMWNNSILMTRCDVKGLSVRDSYDNQVYLSQSGQQFKVIQSNDSFAVIQILNYSKSKEDSLGKENNSFETPFLKYNYDAKSGEEARAKFKTIGKQKEYDSAQKYFKVSVEEIRKHANQYHKVSPSIAFGLLNLPFKARIQAGKSDFSGSLNINNAVGVTYGHQSWRKMTFSTILSYGVSNTLLDSISVSRNHNRLTSSNTFPTLTLAIGQVVTFDKVQVGIFLGIDRLSRQNQDTFGWTYNGDPWLSVGFGYSIFSIEKESKNTKLKDLDQKIAR